MALAQDGIHLAVADRLEQKASQARFHGTLYMAGSIALGMTIIGIFFQFTIIQRQTISISPADENFISLIGAGILRIGMVLLAIFLIQILVGFSRYYFRLAEHLSLSADVIRLSNGNPKLIKELASVLLPTFDFGKIPTSPIQKIVETSMDAIKELAKKVPAR